MALGRERVQPVGSEEQLIPRGSALQAGTKEERRAAALDTSTTGDGDRRGLKKMKFKMHYSLQYPPCPLIKFRRALPLPLTGLPDGWTMEQWVAYGHLWWEQNGP